MRRSVYPNLTCVETDIDNSARIEKLFFKKDLILNAEWNKLNKPPHRMVNLHRHPVFFGNVVDVVGDCCGFCPEPLNDEEKAVAEEEGKLYVKGAISFLSDDPGRQEIGSFYPLGPEDYTDMAYVGSSQVVCDAIVNNDVDIVRSWCQQDGVDVDVRDFCGRTPLHLACMSTTTEMEVVQCLIDHGARLVARLQDGRTALHLAAARGSVEMVTALLRKSAENEHERDEKLAAAGKKLPLPEDQDAVMKDKEEDSDDSSSSGEDDDNGSDDSFSKIHRSDAGSVQAPTVTTSGFVKVDLSETIDGDNDTVVDDIYDINITDWDYLMTPLHHAILGEHTDVIETLVSDFGADVRKPVLKRDHDQGWHTSNALLNLVLALKLSEEKRYDILATLLKLGASSTQATLNQDGSKTSALNYLVSSGEIPALETVFEHDTPGAMSVLNNVIRGRGTSISPLITAIHKEKPELIHYLLKKGAHTDITSEDIVRNMKASERQKLDAGRFQSEIATSVSQPLFFALCHNLDAQVVEALIKAGAELNAVLGKSLSYEYHQTPRKFPVEGLTLLDYARKNIFGARELARVSAHTITTLEETSKKIEEVKKEKTQEELFPDEWVLAQNTDDTYSHFAARILVQKRVLLRSRPKPVYIGYNGYYATPLELAMFNLQHANKLLVEYVKIEPLLEAAGAKTYFELHLEMLPEYLATKNGKMEDFRLPEALRTSNKDKEMSPESLFSAPQLFGALQPFGMLQPVAQMPGEIQRPEFSLGTFHTPYLGKGDVQGGYMRIFEAAWRGLPEDLEMVRMLTSGPSGEGDSRVPALRMAVTDSNNLNAMFIALIRENYDMVDLILQIVKEQYEPAPVVIQKPEGFESENGDVEPQRYIEDDDSEHDPVAEAEAVEQNMTKSDTSPWVCINSCREYCGR